MFRNIDITQSNLSAGIRRAFRICCSVTFGFGLCLAVVVAPSALSNPTAYWTLVLTVAAILALELWHYAQRHVPQRFSKFLSALISAAIVAGIFLEIWGYRVLRERSTYSEPILNAIVFASIFSLALQRIRDVYGGLVLFARRGSGAVVFGAFLCAVAIGIFANVPMVRPGLIFGLAASSAIVTLSIGWFALFLGPGPNTPVD